GDSLGIRRRASRCRRSAARTREHGRVRCRQRARAVGAEHHPALDREVWPLAQTISGLEIDVTQLDFWVDVLAAKLADQLDLVDEFAHRDRRADRRRRRWPRVAVEILVDHVETVLPAPRADLLAEGLTPLAAWALAVELREVGKLFPCREDARDQR